MHKLIIVNNIKKITIIFLILFFLHIFISCYYITYNHIEYCNTEIVCPDLSNLIDRKEGAKHIACIYETYVIKWKKKCILHNPIYLEYDYFNLLWDQNNADLYLYNNFNNMSIISTPFKIENEFSYYKNYNKINLTDLKFGLQELDIKLQKNNIIIDDLVLDRNIIINNTNGFIIDGNDINILKKFSISWIFLTIIGCRNIARLDFTQIDFCTFSSFLLFPHTFHRCMNFCFKEIRLYPYQNLYGDIKTANKILELNNINKNNTNWDIYYYWDNYKYKFYFIYFILFILFTILIIKNGKKIYNKKYNCNIKNKYYNNINKIIKYKYKKINYY